VSHPDALVAVLDANVLYPQWLRDLMLTLAAIGYYEPRWSDRIIDEMRRNVLANHPDIGDFGKQRVRRPDERSAASERACNRLVRRTDEESEPPIVVNAATESSICVGDVTGHQ
jgi:hypothetical protein